MSGQDTVDTTVTNTAGQGPGGGEDRCWLGLVRRAADQLQEQEMLAQGQRLDGRPAYQAWEQAETMSAALDALEAMTVEAPGGSQGQALLTALRVVLGELIMHEARAEGGHGGVLRRAWDEPAVLARLRLAYQAARGDEAAWQRPGQGDGGPPWADPRRHQAQLLVDRWLRDLLPQAVSWVLQEPGISLTNSLCRDLVEGRLIRVVSQARLPSWGRELCESLAQVLPQVRRDMEDRLTRRLLQAGREQWPALRPESSELALTIKSFLYSQRQEASPYLMGPAGGDHGQDEPPQRSAVLFQELVRGVWEECLAERMESLDGEVRTKGDELSRRLRQAVCPSGSAFLLDRLAQGLGGAADDSDGEIEDCWEELLAHLGRRLPSLAQEAGQDFDSLPRVLAAKMLSGELEQALGVELLMLWGRAKELRDASAAQPSESLPDDPPPQPPNGGSPDSKTGAQE